MTLEQDLDEVELQLGFEPISGINHPNPGRNYPAPITDWWHKLWDKITGKSRR
jgi:hypothetical protein